MNPDVLTVIHLNARGLRARLNELRILTAEKSPDLVLITESKIRNGLQRAARVNITNYNCHRLDADQGKSGVAIYSAKNLKCYRLPPVELCLVEHLGVEITTAQGPLQVFSVYVTPGAVAYESIAYIARKYPKVVMIGDYNAHHHLWNSYKDDYRGKALVRLINDEDLVVIAPATPTRIAGKDSIVDYALAKKFPPCTNIATLSSIGSDHLRLMLHFKTDPSTHRKSLYIPKPIGLNTEN